MHDVTDRTHWHEPKAGENAGFGKYKRPPMPYDRFIESEGGWRCELDRRKLAGRRTNPRIAPHAPKSVDREVAVAA